MWSICKKELVQFFSNLTGYLAIVLFMIINGIFLFLLQDSSIFEYGYASMENFFDLAPWVLMFLMPAITMRTFSDEYKAGTFETLITKPVSTLRIVLGKFFAVLLIQLFVLMPTLIYVFTIRSLSATGSIDTGGIAGSYLGLFLLASTFSALGLFSSSLTSNPVIAFLISSFSCLTLYFGFHALSRIPVFESGADYYIEMIGIDLHYRSVSRGVIFLRDFVYFMSFISFFIFLTNRNISTRR